MKQENAVEGTALPCFREENDRNEQASEYSFYHGG